MSSNTDNPFGALKRIFHEPNRMAILSALCRAANGRSFKELKDDCDLTDGNLSRHLKALEEANVILIEKTFVGAKPRTTVMLTDHGRESFVEYLQALEEVLVQAAEAASTNQEEVLSLFSWLKTAEA